MRVNDGCAWRVERGCMAGAKDLREEQEGEVLEGLGVGDERAQVAPELAVCGVAEGGGEGRPLGGAHGEARDGPRIGGEVPVAWDAMGRDGMGCDGMGWDEMG
jgi:hypothetical protein